MLQRGLRGSRGKSPLNGLPNALLTSTRPVPSHSFTAGFSPTTRRYLPLPKPGTLPMSQPVFSPPRPQTQPHDAATHSDPSPSTPSTQPRAAPQPLQDTPRTKRAQFLEQLAAAKAKSKTQTTISSHIQSTGALKSLNAAAMYGGPSRHQFSRSVPPSAEAGTSNARRQEEHAGATTLVGKSVRGAKPSLSASASPVLRQDAPLPPSTVHGLDIETRPPAQSSEKEIHHAGHPPSEILLQRKPCTRSNEDAQTKRLPERVIVPHDEQQQLSKSHSGSIQQQQSVVVKTPGPKAARVQVAEPGPSSTRPTAIRIASTERTREDGKGRVGPVAKTRPAKTTVVTGKAKTGVMTADKGKTASAEAAAAVPPAKKAVTSPAKPGTSTTAKPVSTTRATVAKQQAVPAAAPRPAVKKKPTSPSKPLLKTTSSTSKALVGAKSRALAKGPNAAGSTTTTTAGMARDAIMAARQAEVAKLKAENKARCEMAKLSAAAVHAAKRAKARSGRLGDRQLAPKRDHEAEAQKETVTEQAVEQVTEAPEPLRIKEDPPTTTASKPADEEEPTATPQTSQREAEPQQVPSWSPSRFSPRRLNVCLPPHTPSAKCPSSPLMPLGQHTPFNNSRGAALGPYSSPAEKLMKSLGATPRQPFQKSLCELKWEDGEDQENRPPGVAAGVSDWAQEM